MRASERRPLRELSGGLLAVPAAAASADRCDLPLRPHRRRHRRRRRRDARPSAWPTWPRIAPTCWRSRPAGRRRRAGPTSSGRWPRRIVAHRLPVPLLARPARRLRAGRRPDRATPTEPSCSTTAAARRTRSAACCCTSTASTTPARWRSPTPICTRAAARQLLAGPRRRPAARPALRAARRCVAARRRRSTSCSRGATATGVRALVADLVAWARELMLLGRAAGRTRCRGRAGWELRFVVQGGLRVLEKIDRLGGATLTARPTIGAADAPLLAWRALRCADAARAHRRATRRWHVAAMTTPEQYVQDKAAASGSSFYYAFLFLTPPRRAAITAFYAFCREVDDVADEVSDPGVAATKLAWWRSEVGAAFAGKPQPPGDARADAARRRLRHRAARTCWPSSKAARWTSTSRATSTSRPARATAISSPASSARSRPASSAARARRRSTMRTARPGDAAHQHRPRRRRRRAARPHLPADERAASSSTSRRTRSLERAYSDRFTALMRFQAERAHRTYDEALRAAAARPIARRRSPG